MKKFYPLALTVLSLVAFSFSSKSQTYSGGTYTAINSKPWHVASGPNAWDPSGEPPAGCSNCHIIINTGVTVTLNTSYTLGGGSVLTIGTTDDAAAELLISSSNGADWASSHNIIILNDGSSPANAVVLANSSAFINATNADQSFDGVFTTYNSSPITYYRQVGTGPSSYVGTTVANSRTFSNNIQTGPATLTGNGNLPITLADFSAVLDGSQVKLTWITEMESNSDHFTILRSINAGSSWTSIGTVAAHGNSSTTIDYSFTDAEPGAGVSEYRLQSFDKDGKSALSPIVIVRNGLVNISFFPNPAKDNVYIAIPESVTGNLSIRLYSQVGQLLVEKSLNNAGGSTVALAVGNYPQGNYVLIVNAADGSRQVSKLVISK